MIVGERDGVAGGVNDLGEEDVPGGAHRTIGLAEDQLRTVSREQLVAIGAGAREQGLVVLLVTKRLRGRVETRERALPTTPNVVFHIRQKIARAVGEVGNPIASPL